MPGPRRQPVTNEASSDKEEMSLLWIVAVLLRDRRIVLGFTTVGLVLGVAIALLRRPTYSSTFSFLPQATQDASRSGLASLAGQFGIPLAAIGGSMQSPELYADLILTREVLIPIGRDSYSVDRGQRVTTPLSKLLGAGGSDSAIVLDNTLRMLRTQVVSAAVSSRTGMVSVTVRTRYPQVSLQIAQRLLQGLNDFNLVTRQSQAREERRFTEGRYNEARATLRSAEDALQQFLQANRQYANSPQLSFERERLQREVNLQQQVVTTLAQQYEETRIREVRDTPVITVIEKPTLAARPDARLRAVLLLLTMLVTFLLSVLFLLFRDAWKRDRTVGRDRAVALISREWKRLRGATTSD